MKIYCNHYQYEHLQQQLQKGELRGARMRRKYYYFYSGGSIYTLSTQTRRGSRSRRMGHYMKKPKRVQKMEVSQSSMLGVRTRARTRALEKQAGFKCGAVSASSAIDAPCSSSKRSKDSSSLEIEPHYMELRSRRIAKADKCRECENEMSIEPRIAPSSAPLFESHQFDTDVLVSAPRAQETRRQCNADLSEVPPRNSCSTRPSNLSVMLCSARHSDALNYSRLDSPLAVETSSSGTLARNRPCSLECLERLEMETDLGISDMEIDRAPLGGAGPSNIVEREMEVVTSCFGGSPTIAGHVMRERFTRECTPDSAIRHAGAPASSSRRVHRTPQMRSLSAPPFSRSSEVPSSSDIEAFFSSAEQKERKRFIDRYNFDPLTEKPLKGRYLWMKKE